MTGWEQLRREQQGQPKAKEGQEQTPAPFPSHTAPPRPRAALTHQDGAVRVDAQGAAAGGAGGRVLHAVGAADGVEAPLGAAALRVALPVLGSKARAEHQKRVNAAVEHQQRASHRANEPSVGWDQGKPTGLHSKPFPVCQGILPSPRTFALPGQSTPASDGHGSTPFPHALSQTWPLGFLQHQTLAWGLLQHQIVGGKEGEEGEEGDSL